ncbi:hypothetical protein OMB55_00024150 [gamma proteobacterium HIMB55]|nr:hypothetical protein OMB55_00024150 [gamma proteobacterium HIMB55]
MTRVLSDLTGSVKGASIRASYSPLQWHYHRKTNGYSASIWGDLLPT